MINNIIEMAKRIEHRWDKFDNNYVCFADIAYDEMLKTEIVSKFNYLDIIDYLEDHYIKTVQISSDFSELHIKLFDNGKFYIEILNWFNRDTSIHDHGFTGVFLQLLGSSINSVYSFQEEIRISHNLCIGYGSLTESKISRAGDYRIIPYGRSEKHSVFHLEKPTISMIVRTHPIIELSPQLNYFPPYIRIDHSAVGLIFKKKINYFINLYDINKDLFREKFIDIMNKSSYTENIWLLIKLSNLIYTPDNIDILTIYSNNSENEKDGEIRKKLIASATFHKYSKFIVDKVKPIFGGIDDRIILSALSGSYSVNDINIMQNDLGIKLDAAVIYELASKIPVGLKSDFNTAIKILEI